MADQRRGPWSQHEDAYLMDLVNTQGPLNWVKISTMLGTRTPKQCRERYHQNLKPSLNHEPITAEEGELIEQLVAQLGKRWAEIARRLHNRSDNAVKNWWNGSMNRRRRLTRKRSPYDDSNDAYPYSRAPARLQLPTGPVQYTQYPLPSPTNSTSRYSQSSWGMTPSLASPTSAITHTNEPALDGAPSLMSDSGSYYSESPTAYGPPESPNFSLPPLRYGDSASTPRCFAVDHDPKQLAHSLQLPCIRDALDGRTQLPTAPNSPVTLPAPRMLQDARLRHNASRSPSNLEPPQAIDPRMKLNNLLH
ncbi:hypothetical protein JX265_012749 [Neoarthrinium moseri]|uniref:Uncharacterized protein n=1 Tax=Neoarthrinium moseri TaxID=1658444 RepID=A0A9Q0AJA5_9PEZI|nr:uncharacterized protein JN550_008836 [Neoarthrinium moseri]KAI1849498.1 hypothetical protein JX266_004993 [Neoarthrinium moseri]KAI1853458.1 hypothetical protein JX265_012749 [Neoarthrinium moseri]KAI1864549.1 hypothetical protein JN550_008836 [Neoarthrinium moseri]